MNKISVIIPTYKSPDSLDLCLKSLIEGQANKNQLLVVVDGHYDLNKDVLEKYKEHIDILDLPENQGLSRATNLGVYNTLYDRILIINDDNVACEFWDEKLNKHYDRNPNSVISPNQVEPTPSMFSQFLIKDLGRDPKTFNLNQFNNYLKSFSNPTRTLDNTGSTLPIFMNKTDYLRVGGWDENYELGLVSDWDFFLKCQLSGLKMLRLYTCSFYHFTSLSVNGEKRRQAEINAHEYARYKWGKYISHDPITNLKYL
jgi:GT2 family glycosyltransferase